MMSIIDPIAIGVEKIKINSGCLLKKKFIKLIYTHP